MPGIENYHHRRRHRDLPYFLSRNNNNKSDQLDDLYCVKAHRHADTRKKSV